MTDIWEICGRICSKRLQPFLPEIVQVLERHNELRLEPETKRLLLAMSRATIDRCLQPARFEPRRGLSTTQPGSLLKEANPIRTWAEWNDTKPGFLELDLVAHCGDITAGVYLNTLTGTVSPAPRTTGNRGLLCKASYQDHLIFSTLLAQKPELLHWFR